MHGFAGGGCGRESAPSGAERKDFFARLVKAILAQKDFSWSRNENKNWPREKVLVGCDAVTKSFWGEAGALLPPSLPHWIEPCLIFSVTT